MVDIAASFLDLKKKFNDKKATLDYIESRIVELKSTKDRLIQEQQDGVSARAILQDIALKTQQNLEFHVSNLVTTALKHVETEWPDYAVKFVKRRNKTECDLLFIENGKEQHPLKGGGGGAADVSAYAQLVSYWTLIKNNPILFLDEPFRNVSPDYQNRVSEMLKMVCDKIHIQTIMVSHAEDINIAADKTFTISKEGDKSFVKEE